MEVSKRYGLLVLFVWCVFPLWAQSFSARADSTLFSDFPLTGKKNLDIQLDPLGQLYVLEESEWQKYSPKGALLFSYSNNNFGAASHLDTRDPFSLLLFYPDFQTTILLDRTMSERSRLDVSALGFYNVSLLCLDREGALWLFDEQAYRLRRIDRAGEVLDETPSLQQLFPGIALPVSLYTDGNFVFLGFADGRVLVFDNFGNFQLRLELDAEEISQVRDQKIIFRKEKEWFSYQLKTQERKKIDLPDDHLIRKVLQHQGRVYFLTEGGRVLFTRVPR